MCHTSDITFVYTLHLSAAWTVMRCGAQVSVSRLWPAIAARVMIIAWLTVGNISRRHYSSENYSSVSISFNEGKMFTVSVCTLFVTRKFADNQLLLSLYHSLSLYFNYSLSSYVFRTTFNVLWLIYNAPIIARSFCLLMETGNGSGDSAPRQWGQGSQAVGTGPPGSWTRPQSSRDRASQTVGTEPPKQ